MFLKKPEGETHTWATRGSEESIIFIKFQECCYSHYLCRPICRTLPTPPPPRLWKIVLPDIFCCCFIHICARTTLKTCSESSFPGGSVDTSFQLSRPAFPEQRNHHFKPQKMIWEVSVGLCRRKDSRESFLHLQTVIAQLRIGLESWNGLIRIAGDWGFWICLSNFSCMFVIEMAMQNVLSVPKQSMWWNRHFLGSHSVDESGNMSTYGAQLRYQ